ncbi:hypothetical protein WJX81_007250 [Elliptochloris bilobata]|uniref:Anaphase-promoting complex subunit 1 N-terminal domain-containing protein n=1 Tax=Elliptochloris bilobata TaxID=381761 RepID=A0AAW1QD00_9CHLO
MAMHQSCRAAITLGSARPFGEDILAADAHHLGEPFSSITGRCFFYGGRSHTQGDAAFDEEIYVHGCKVVWSAGRQLRRRFTTEAPVLQVAWCRFQDEGEALCLLQAGALSTYTLAGELQTVPLPPGFTTMWALPQGLLLTGSAGVRPSVLAHPLEELQAAGVEGGAWQGDSVVWASRELPYLATYSPGLARLAVWAL